MLVFYVKSIKVPQGMDMFPTGKLPPLVHDAPIDKSINIVLTNEEAQACAKQCQEQNLPYSWIRSEDPALVVKKLTQEEADRYFKYENRQNGQG